MVFHLESISWKPMAGEFHARRNWSSWDKLSHRARGGTKRPLRSAIHAPKSLINKSYPSFIWAPTCTSTGHLGRKSRHGRESGGPMKKVLLVLFIATVSGTSAANTTK